MKKRTVKKKRECHNSCISINRRSHLTQALIFPSTTLKIRCKIIITCVVARVVHVDGFFIVLQNFENEEDLLQTATTDITQLCAENVILWTQFIEVVSLDKNVLVQLAQEHHTGRVCGKKSLSSIKVFHLTKQLITLTLDLTLLIVGEEIGRSLFHP